MMPRLGAVEPQGKRPDLRQINDPADPIAYS
jgi:hypothetical protein